MELYDAVFYFFGLITLVSAWIVVSSRNIVYSAFALLFTFFGVTGLYVLLSADFLAIAQLLIYVGGILVLLLFGVMLTNKVVNVDIKTGTMGTIPALILAGSTGGALFAVFYATDWRIVRGAPQAPTTTDALGQMFMTTYLLPFEVASIALLVALIGAALIARRERVVRN
ncbi:MAG TPA: NADH-quinone oxidoreductase subunit J [Bacteroidota bacterium]|jgi:NADH-quinone oxidoreductase subunit J